MISRVLLFCMLSITLATTTFSQSKKKKSAKPITLFAIGEENVYTDEFSYLFSKNHQRDKDESSDAAIQEYLQLFINFKLKVREAKAQGMDTTRAFREEFQSYKKELLKPYLPDAKIIDSLSRLTYDRMKQEVRASHILISLAPDATPADTMAAYSKIMDLKNRIASGESFESLAPLYSDDPSAKSNKGDLGYFTAMQMVYPFENGAYATSVGKVGGPVRTKFGYHLIKVTDRRPARGEVEVAHIMLRTGEGHDLQKVKDQIFSIYDMLKAGANWDELVGQHSEDQSSKDTGGKLRPFGVGAMAAVPEFEKAAFSLQSPGDFSDPFQTTYGWHIVHLEKKIPLADYEVLKSQLRTSVTKDDRLQLSKEAVMEKYKQEFNFTENKTVKDQILKLADSTLTSGKWNANAHTGSSKDILFTLNNKPVEVQKFFDYVKGHQSRSSQKPFEVLEHHYDEFVNINLMQALEEQIAIKNPDFAMLTREYYEGILLFNIMEKKVWNKAAQDTIGQQKYYALHSGEYTAGPRAKATLFEAHSDAFRDKLKSLLLSNDSAAVEKFVTEMQLRKETGSFEKDERTIFAQMAWEPGIYNAENNGMYYLAAIQAILPPGVKTFEESRAQVITDYQNELEQQWIKELRSKYPVKINEKGRKHVFEKLQK